MHVIRLRHPWEKRHLGSDVASRVDVPDKVNTGSIDPAQIQTTVQYRRPFNRPTGLDADDQVYLRVTEWSGKLDFITLNGHPIAIAKDAVFVAIRDQLALRNLIVIQLSQTTDQSPGLTGEVTIEID